MKRRALRKVYAYASASPMAAEDSPGRTTSAGG